MYCDPDCKPWTSGSWAPEGFASRADLINQDHAAEAGKPPVGEEDRIEQVNEKAIEA